MKQLKNIIIKILYSFWKLSRLGYLYHLFLIIKAQKRQRKAIKKLEGKPKIKVAFFAIHTPVWKYEGVYRLMEQDKRFEPIVIVCPYVTFGKENMINELDATYKWFKDNNYHVINSFIKESGIWLDVKKEIKPDIVFFTNPHKLTRKEYYITNYIDTLTCYVPYSFHITHLNELQYNQIFHNLLWKVFYETNIHLNLAKQYAINKGCNIVISGYPGIDIFLDRTYVPTDKWKIKDRDIKRIIWAPHHSIDDRENLNYSTFLDYYQFMLNIAHKYKNATQIAFKPHPILKLKLYDRTDWGKEKTDEYYNTWNNISNGQLEEADYIDLFLTSDAMILDSASFMTEYFYTKNPSIFTVKDEKLSERFNIFGNMVFNQLYHSFNQKDIEEFIINTVIEGNDPLKSKRISFMNEFLIPPGNNSASGNIVEEIKTYIN